MEGNGRPDYNFKNITRLPDSIRSKTTVTKTEPKKLPISNANIQRDDKYYPETRSRESNTECGEQPKLPLYSVFKAKKRRKQSTNFQSESIERVHRHESFQDNKHVPNSKFSTAERLVMQNRPVTGLLPSANCEITQMLSPASLQQQTVRNEMPTLRSQYSTKDFRNTVELDGPNYQKSGYQGHCLPRRFLDRKSRFDSFEQSHENSDKNPPQVRLAAKLAEIDNCTTKIVRVSRSDVVPLAESHGSPREEVSENNFGSIKFNFEKKRIKKRVRKSVGPTEFCKFRRAERQTELQKSPETTNHLSRKPTSEVLSSKLLGDKGLEMVERQLPKSSVTSCPVPRSLSDDRCIKHRLGGNSRRPLHIGCLDCRRTETSLQRERNVGHPKMLTRTMSNPEIQLNFNTNGQQNRDCIFTQRRWYEIFNLDGSCVPSIPSYGHLPDSFHNSSYTRHLQHRSRRPLKATSTTRMAFTSGSDSEYISKMGYPCDRPICIKKCSCCPNLWNIRQKRQGRCNIQCAGKAMELPSSVGLPTTFPYPKSISAHESSIGSIPACSTAVGARILEGRPSEPRHCSPIHSEKSRTSSPRRHNSPSTTESQRNNSGGMEMWGWTETLSAWSNAQKDLLKSSWRPSTLNTYKPAWNRWTRWAQTNGVEITNPSGGDLARYLADLFNIEGLSYSTILVHKSVISTFCNPESANSLSSHFLVKQVLKAISLKKPKEPKPPIWDINLVANHLTKRRPDCNLYDTARHTATLLLLCSGRRVHDLTLLQCDPNHLITVSEDEIIFWPSFGSKTDTFSHRQSGWRLIRNKICRALDPIFWVNRLISLSSERRLLTKCNKLFIRITGPAEAASRTVIGGWVKSVLKDAGISATPGSVRAAVASKNWTENFQIDEILARGNWRSSNTFKKYYRREVLTHTPSDIRDCEIQNLFSPVD